MESPDKGHAEHLRDVISTVACLRGPLGLTYLAEFLSMAVGDIRSALQHVHSVVVTPDDDNYSVRFVHLTFQDFLQDKDRCTDDRFFVDVPAYEHFMALRCLRVLKTPGAFDSGGKFYAYSNWTSHVRSATHHDLSDELARELIWLIGDEETLEHCYFYLLGDEAEEDIIPFVRSLAVCIFLA